MKVKHIVTKPFKTQGFKSFIETVMFLYVLCSEMHRNMMFLSVTWALQDPLYMWQHRFVQLGDKPRLTQIRKER
jgi:hypothetical protein